MSLVSLTHTPGTRPEDKDQLSRGKEDWKNALLLFTVNICDVNSDNNEKKSDDRCCIFFYLRRIYKEKKILVK